MTRKEAALLLIALSFSTYSFEDEDEALLMQEIKMKLMNVHPDQMEAVRRGDRLRFLLNALLITLVSFLLLGSLAFVLFGQ
jgi:hypothetical protein